MISTIQSILQKKSFVKPANLILIILLILALPSCAPRTNSTPENSPTLPPATAEALTPTAVETIEPAETSTTLNVDDLIPMYMVENTAALTQADMLPELDITTNAETLMRDARFGGQLDLVVKFIYKFLNLDTSINWHTFHTVYALNSYAYPPVYTVFIYDLQADCLRYPFFHNEPDSIQVTHAHSGDVTEIDDLAEASGAFIYYACLTPPVGLGDSVKTRLIATKTGIVPGAFFDDLFVGWFDFENRIWHLTEEAKGWLNILDTNPGLQENLTNWLSGQTVIAETEVFDNGRRSRKFNIFDPAIRLSSGMPQYYGVLLGSDVIDEQLFIFLGFEDVNSKRYYLPFNLGQIKSTECKNQFTAVTSNIGKQHQNAGDQSSIYQCADLAQIMRIFTNKPMAVSQIIADSIGIIPAAQAAEFEAQREYASALAKFIYDSAYSMIGNNTLEGRVNAAPESINASDYPRSFIYQFKVQKVDF